MSPVRYAGGVLDRATKLRDDDDWISAALVSEAAMAVLLHEDRNFVTRADRREDTRAAIVPLSTVGERVVTSGASWVFLGLDGEVPMFGVDVSSELIVEVSEIGGAGEFADLRKIGSLVPPAEADAGLRPSDDRVAKASSLLHGVWITHGDPACRAPPAMHEPRLQGRVVSADGSGGDHARHAPVVRQSARTLPPRPAYTPAARRVFAARGIRRDR